MTLFADTNKIEWPLPYLAGAFSSVFPKRSGLKQGTHIETRSVVHRYAMFQSVFYRICCASSISSTIGDAIGRTIH